MSLENAGSKGIITEKQANVAREEHADLLASLGAHALSVDEVMKEGKKGFAITAFVEKKTKKMPATLEIKSGKKSISVPLIIKVADSFKPE